MPDFRLGSKCEKLTVSKSGPLHPTKRTAMRGAATSLNGPTTKIRLLFNYLVGAPQNRNWKRQSQLPRGLEIHH